MPCICVYEVGKQESAEAGKVGRSEVKDKDNYELSIARLEECSSVKRMIKCSSVQTIKHWNDRTFITSVVSPD